MYYSVVIQPEVNLISRVTKKENTTVRISRPSFGSMARSRVCLLSKCLVDHRKIVGRGWGQCSIGSLRERPNKT